MFEWASLKLPTVALARRICLYIADNVLVMSARVTSKSAISYAQSRTRFVLRRPDFGAIYIFFVLLVGGPCRRRSCESRRTYLPSQEVIYRRQEVIFKCQEVICKARRSFSQSVGHDNHFRKSFKQPDHNDSANKSRLAKLLS